MKFFIDTHGHYAWDVDDGIPTREEAFEALKQARKQKIRIIVATPHIIPGTHTKEDVLEVKQRIRELKKLAGALKMYVFEGCELFLNHECIDAIHDELFIPVENSDYLLTEFDVRKELGSSSEVEDYLYEIEIKGYTPIIAHVERYFKEEIDIDRIRDLVESGYIIQVNASSLLGIHGKVVQKNAYTLLDEGLVHLIASDTHRANGRRKPNLMDVYNLLQKRYDDNTLELLLSENPKHILKNEPVENIKPKRSLLKKLWKRR